MFAASLLRILALSGLSLHLVSALPALEDYNQLDPRAKVCNADNCLRAVRATAANPGPPSSFCESFLSTTPVTTVTSYTTIVSTPAAPTVTSIIGTTTQTIGIQCTATSTSTQYFLSTSTDLETASTTIFVKRAQNTPLSAVISSSCAASGACSCFLSGSASTSTVSSTITVPSTAATPPAITFTSSYLSTSTVSSCTNYSTSIIVVSSSLTTTTTLTASTTLTSTTSIPSPTCVLKSSPPAGAVCGVYGFTGNEKGLGPLLIDSQHLTPEGCALACQQYANCDHFYFSSGSKFCELHTVSLATEGFQSDPTSFYEAYELICFNCSAS